MLDVPIRMGGAKAVPHLLKPHIARLLKAADVLEVLAALPCDEQQEAGQVGNWLKNLAAIRAVRGGQFLPGQLELPFDAEETE